MSSPDPFRIAALKRVRQDLLALDKEIPAHYGRAYYEDGNPITCPEITLPLPLITFEIEAGNDLIPFDSQDLVSFRIQVPESYPANPPFVWYRRRSTTAVCVSAAGEQQKQSACFDEAMMVKISDVGRKKDSGSGNGSNDPVDSEQQQLSVSKGKRGSGDKNLKVVSLPLLDQDDDSAWSRSYDLVVVFHALRQLFQKTEIWWKGAALPQTEEEGDDDEDKPPIFIIDLPQQQQAAVMKHSHNNLSRIRPDLYITSGHGHAQGVRKTMEDAISIIEHTKPLDPSDPSTSVSLYFIFDGHGGQDCALFAASHLPKLLLNGLATAGLPSRIKSFEGDASIPPPPLAAVKAGGGSDPNYPSVDCRGWAQALHNSFRQVDEAFLGEQAKHANVPGGTGDVFNGGCSNEVNFSGTTALVVLIDRRGRLLCATLGDCRAVLCRKGRAVVVSAPEHKATRKDEIARIVDVGGFVQNARVMGQLAITRALGDAFFKGFVPTTQSSVSNEAEVTELFTGITPGPEEDAFLVMACDGLWDVMSSQEVVDFVASRLDLFSGPGRSEQDVLSEASDALVDEAIYSRGSRDNVTAIIIRFSEVPLRPEGNVPYTFTSASNSSGQGLGTLTSTDSFYLPPGSQIAGCGPSRPPKGLLFNGSKSGSEGGQSSPISVAAASTSTTASPRQQADDAAAVNTEVSIDALLRELSSVEDVEEGTPNSSRRSSNESTSITASAGAVGRLSLSSLLLTGVSSDGEGSYSSSSGMTQQGIQSEKELMEYLMNDQNFKA